MTHINNTVDVHHLALILIAIGLVTLIILLYNSVVVVGGAKLAVLERRWLGKKIPEGRVVALNNEVGIQARTLGPGLHFLTPFIYKAIKYPILTINEKEVAVVEAIDGKPIQAGRIFARRSAGHNLYQDGASFIQNGGQKGPQIDIIPPGSYRINPYLFRIKKYPSTIIETNEVGIILANDGESLASGSLLGKHLEGHNHFQDGEAFLQKNGQKGPQIDILLPGQYRINPELFQVKIAATTVIPKSKIGIINAESGRSLSKDEFVAQSVDGHENFQNGAQFLANGGQRGPQKDFLKPGTYYINPYLFKVELKDELQVKRGEVAVIVSSIGQDPSQEPVASTAISGADYANKKGIERYVVPDGYRGIQQSVLGPGRYYLNLVAYTPYLIPTTNITIDWANNQNESRSADTDYSVRSSEVKTPTTLLDPLSIVSNDGFQMQVEVKVIIRILPEQAPHMLGRIGTVRNLVDNVIHPLIDSSFRNQASSTAAMQFLQNRHQEQVKARDHVAQELEKYHVDCVSVLICQIILPESLMQTLTSKVVASQQMAMFDAQEEAEGRRKEMERTRAQAEMQPNLVKAELDVQIASQRKSEQIILAQGKSESTRLEQEGVAAGLQSVGLAEATKIAAIGKATAEAYQQQVEALGKDSLSLIEVMKKISDSNIKITPDVLVQSGNDGTGMQTVGELLSALMAKNLKNDSRSDKRSN